MYIKYKKKYIMKHMRSYYKFVVIKSYQKYESYDTYEWYFTNLWYEWVILIYIDTITDSDEIFNYIFLFKTAV